MIKLTKNDNIKINILMQYKKKNISYTASILSGKLKCKFETARKALEFFYRIGVIDKEIKEHGKKIYTYYNLTESGSILLMSLRD